MSKLMDNLDDDSLLQILYSTRPTEYLVLIKTSSRLHDFIVSNKYLLFKHWSNTELTTHQLQEYIPNLTLRQLEFVADYYYPYKRLEYYEHCELVANSLKTNREYWDLTEKDNIINRPIIDTITYVLAPDLTTNYGLFDTITGIKYLLRFRDTPSDMIMKRVETQGEHLPGIKEYMNDKWYPGTKFKDAGRLYHFDVLRRDMPLAHKLSPEYMEIMRELSRYDSKKYPSYDPLDDLCSGNYLELLHKVNTWDRNITVQTVKASKRKDGYLSWSGERSYISNLNQHYVDISSQIVGQAALHIHPSIIDRYLECRGYSLQDTPDNYYLLLQRWCFPDKSLDEVKRIKYVGMKLVYNLSCYYEPAVIIDNWRGDINILLDVSLQQNLADERIRLLISGHPFDDISATSAIILLYKYNRLYLRDAIHGGVWWRSLYNVLAHTPTQIDYDSMSHLYMILNHTYLTIDEKLYILSWYKELPGSLIDGLSGNSYNDSWCIAGNILNMYGSPEAVKSCLDVFGIEYSPITSLQYIDDTLDDLRQGRAHGSLFPLGLLWKETTYFRITDSYMDDLLELVKNSEYRTKHLLGQARKYYEFAVGMEWGDIISSIYCAGPYGYNEYNPLNRVI